MAILPLLLKVQRICQSQEVFSLSHLPYFFYPLLKYEGSFYFFYISLSSILDCVINMATMVAETRMDTLDRKRTWRYSEYPLGRCTSGSVGLGAAG